MRVNRVSSMNQDVNESIKDTTVDRAEFSAAITKLLKAPPASKQAIIDRIKYGVRRSSPRTKPLRDSR